MTSRRGPVSMRALRAISTSFLAVIAWSVLGYFATLPLGSLFGWSGHPALPDAPMSVYIVVYLIVLPVGCVYCGWWLTRWTELRIRRGRDASRH